MLRSAHLVETEKQGKNVIYRIANREVVEFWVSICSLAEDRLVKLKMALAQLTSDQRALAPQDRDSLVKMAKKGDVVVLDMRPAAEYEAANLPYAQSMPIDQLKSRLAELPAGKTIVAYCRGPYCLMAVDAVFLLKQRGFAAIHLPEGVAEWGWRQCGDMAPGKSKTVFSHPFRTDTDVPGKTRCSIRTPLPC